jgi:hypothetical protein
VDGTIARVDFYAGSNLLGSDTTSPYSFTWNNVPAGSYSLTAVARDNGGLTTTSAARTVTVSPPVTNQPPQTSLTAPADGATFAAPATVTLTATASDADGSIAAVEFYAGSTLIGSDSTAPYGVTWSNIGAGTYSLTSRARDNAGTTTVSAARTMTVTGLPAGWTATDIGAPGSSGSSTHSNGAFSLSSTGEVGGSADQFHFVYRQMTGDVEIRARVASIQNIEPWSKGGVMVRESLAANSVMGMMFISSTSGSAFHQRATTGASRTSTTGTNVAAPYWVRLERRGSVLTASQSVNGTTWATIGTMSLSASTIYVGLAVASGNSSQFATGVLDNVTAAALTTNRPPTTSLTGPANGATFTAPATISLTATASDVDGTIARVDFYAGSNLLGSDTTSPYSFTWSNVPAGSYSLTAVARDNSGNATTSSPRTVTVSGGTVNQPPLISLTAPAAGSVFTAPATVTLTATASDVDGSVAVVEFYAGTVQLGSDTAAPYTVSSTFTVGSYSLTAVARDNSGNVTVSGARDIRVDPALLPRTAIFTPSSNHATAVTRYSLEIFPAGANPSTANPVATRDLGKPAIVNGEISVDVSSTTSALPAGSYIATVTAIGSAGSARSAASPTFTK